MTQGPSPSVVCISGGSRGLGRACVEHLLAHDYIVATFSRSKTDFVSALESAEPERFYWTALDVTDKSGVKGFVGDVHRRFGRIDGLINNAGTTLDRLLPVTSDEEIESTLFLNLEAVIHLSRQVCRAMLCHGKGTIVNIGSILGQRGFKGVSVYSATKSALEGFSRSLARELGNRAIRVNCIAPGFLDTDMTSQMPDRQRSQIIRRTPLGRLGQVEDVTGLVRFLLSDEACFITGQTFTIDGGLTC